MLIESDVIDGLTQSPKLSNFRTPSSLSRWVDDRSLDVVLTNTATASALARLRKPPVPVVYFCHGLHWARNAEWSPIWKSAERLLLKHTTAAIVSNTEDEDWFRARIGDARVAKLPYGVGVPIERFPRTATPPLDPRIRIAWIGDFSTRKQPEAAVDVARHLKASGVDFQLTMAGSGPLMGRTATAISKYGLEDQITLPGRKDSGQLITNSHLLLHTSKWEGLARVLLEAVAIGRNTFGFDVKGVRDAPGISVVESGQAEALATAVRENIEAGLPPQGYPDPTAMTSATHARLILGHLERWLDT